MSIAAGTRSAASPHAPSTGCRLPQNRLVVLTHLPHHAADISGYSAQHMLELARRPDIRRAQEYVISGYLAQRCISCCRKQEQPDLYSQYHEGFRSQAAEWPQQPVHNAVSWLKVRPALPIRLQRFRVTLSMLHMVSIMRASCGCTSLPAAALVCHQQQPSQDSVPTRTCGAVQTSAPECKHDM